MKKRKYTRRVNEDTVLYTIKDWDEAVAEGLFNTFDGSGYWVKDGKESEDEVFSTQPQDATHVAWYNK